MTIMPSDQDDLYYDSYRKPRRNSYDFIEEQLINKRQGKWTNFLGYDAQSGHGNREFEDALVNPSYAVSPMKPMRHFLDLGTLVGIFPAKRGDKHIYFGFECCSLQAFWSVMFTVIWFIWGLAVACYCTLNEASITRTNNSGIGSIFEVKTLNKNLVITSTDQVVVVATPFILVLAWIVALVLGWSRIERLSELCYSFCTRGFRIDSSPEVAVILQFMVNYFIFLIGQTIVNVQIALVYCPDSTKQILFSILVTLWMLPIYVVVIFNGYLFCQFMFTLTEYFRQMRGDIESKSAKIQNGNVIYAQVIKKGLPRRYDRLHDNIQIINDIYGIVILFEYMFFHLMMLASLYMAISSVINGVKSQSIPWWFIGYTLLVCHHLLRIYQLAAAGELLQNEVKQVLGMLSQFGFLHADMQILCLTIARKPTESLLTLAGWASLRRSLVGKTLAFVVITMLLIANYKLKES